MTSRDSSEESSENYSSSEESEKMVHSRTPGPNQAKSPNPPIPPSGSESEDDSDSSTPPPIKHHQQEQRKEQQPQKQKDQLPPPLPSSSALMSNKTAATKPSVKRPREEENAGTKKKAKVPGKEKKTAQKQSVAVNVSTPSSPQKSGKKALHFWNSKDELAFLNGLLAFTKEGNEFPKNMSFVFDYIRNTNDLHYSNKQFRGKLRRLKTKFQVVVENMGIKNYNFKSPDEAAIYKISKQLWGVEDGGGDDEHRHIVETARNASVDGIEKKKKKKKKPSVQAEEEDGDKFKKRDQGEEEGDGEKFKDGEEGEEEEEDAPKRDKTMANASVENTAGDIDRIRKERDDMVNQMKNTVAMILKKSEAKQKAMIDGNLLNSRVDHVQSSYSDMTTGIYSVKRAQLLDKVKAEALEEKWRKQQLVEMKAFLGRLDLLQEEYDMYLEGSRELVGGEGHIIE